VSFRVTGALLATLIVLAGVVYYISQQPAPSTSGQAQSNPVILSFASASVNKLVLSGSGKTTEIDQSNGQWILSPTKEPADAGRVGGWVDTLAQLTADRTIDNPTNLATYGLATPKLTVTVSYGGTSAVVDFGDKTPDGGDYYVRLPNDSTRSKSVYLVSSSLGDDLLSALTTPPKAPPTPTPGPTLVPVTPLATPPVATPGATTTPAG